MRALVPHIDSSTHCRAMMLFTLWKGQAVRLQDFALAMAESMHDFHVPVHRLHSFSQHDMQKNGVTWKQMESAAPAGATRKR